MPRTGRLVLPGYSHHIVQRGHNKQVVFAEEADYQYYLNTIREFKAACEITVHAYCLMTNHVHLLLEPETASGLGEFMKRLAGRQTRYFNKQEVRRGTLWEGRYKSSVVDVENYFYACVRYIELNPVRAGMVRSPGEYPWSSYSAHYCGATDDVYIDNIKLSKIKGNDYEAYICASADHDETNFLRESVNRNQLTGINRFIDEIEQVTGRRYERRKQGRPVNK